ncbi:MAG: hypothetical protein JXR53_14080 [Bacteroidales bacterium]|nr:hypothetical protein [Bacteroidales bacterium]
MKRLFLLTLIFAFGLGLMSFSVAKNEKRTEPKSTSEISSPNDWGEWTRTNCYKKLYFRVKKGDYNSYSKEYFWYIQFRNDYSFTIDLSYDACAPGESIDRLTHGHRISAYDTFTTPYFLINSSNYINVSVEIEIDYEKYPCDY